MTGSVISQKSKLNNWGLGQERMTNDLGLTTKCVVRYSSLLAKYVLNYCENDFFDIAEEERCHRLNTLKI